MTLHYHGTPITPRRLLEELAGRCFCVSFYDPRQVARCHEIGQAVMLDNGAFSAWRGGNPVAEWGPYYAWAEEWTSTPPTWARYDQPDKEGPMRIRDKRTRAQLIAELEELDAALRKVSALRNTEIEHRVAAEEKLEHFEELSEKHKQWWLEAMNEKEQVYRERDALRSERDRLDASYATWKRTALALVHHIASESVSVGADAADTVSGVGTVAALRGMMQRTAKILERDEARCARAHQASQEDRHG